MRIDLRRCDASGVLQALSGARDAALLVVAENVVSDCTPHVPCLTGALADSGRASVRAGVGHAEWGGDAETARYARVQYYDESLRHDPRGSATAPCAHWVEQTAAFRAEEWRGMLRDELGRGMRK